MYWPRINDAITDDPLLVYNHEGTLEGASREEALARAHAEGKDLVEEWAARPTCPRGAVVCFLTSWPDAPRWEARAEAPLASEPELDEALWFTHEKCEGRHYLLGNPHTFRGRLNAWCPAKRRGLCVSKSEMTSCSKETEYFVRGFLAGNEPERPVDREGDVLPQDHLDMKAWCAAVALFTETGSWSARVRLCKECDRRLLPSNPSGRCLKVEGEVEGNHRD